MSSAALLKDLKARKFKPLYLLHGEEPFYIDEIVDYISTNLLSDMEKGFNQVVLYGKDTNLATIIQTAKRYPMMSDYQLVIVKEAQDLKWARESEGAPKEDVFIQQYFENPLPSTILVFAYKYANFDKRKKLFKLFSNQGVVFQSDPVRDYKLASWIEDFVKEKGYRISPQASSMMAEYLGTDLSKIANDVEKLCLNVKQDTVIELSHVQQNIGISKEYNVFELQKALSAKNVLKCHQIINYFAANPKANPMVLVMANLNIYFTRILKYHYLPNKQEAAKELGVNPYFIKEYEQAARAFPVQKTFDVISNLRKYDLKSKGLDSTGNVTDGELMKELIFRILH